MNLEIDSEARKELNDFPQNHKEFIIEKFKELKRNPSGHENSGLIRVGGAQVFKFVMKQGSKGGKDYRAVYDIGPGRCENIFYIPQRRRIRQRRIIG